MSKDGDPTRYDALVRRLKDHPVAVVAILAVAVASGLAAILGAIDRWQALFGRTDDVALTLAVQPAGLCLPEFWRRSAVPERVIAGIHGTVAGPGGDMVRRADLAVTINNRGAAARVVTEAELLPDWIVWGATVGMAEVVHAFELSLGEWETAASDLWFGQRAGGDLLEEEQIGFRDGIPHFVDRSGQVWLRPAPLDIGGELRGALVAEPGTPERILVRLGLASPSAILAGVVRVRLAFDDGSESVSGPVWIEVCQDRSAP